MIGQPMSVRVDDNITIKLGPFAREDMGEFIKNGRMQYHSISRYLSIHHALTIEDEQEWYDKTRKDSTSRVWGIWDESDETPKLIGSTAPTRLEESPLRQMTSGSVLFDSSYWGRGIASAIHKARTWYAFNQLDLVRLKSAVLLPNVGSRKALSRSGYFHHSLERNETFVDGKLQHLENLECLNPSPHAWDRWWGNDEPTAEALAAREVTKSALKWADENVTLL